MASARADAYPVHFRGVVPPELQRTSLFLGDYLSPRGAAGRIGFLALTRWQSPDPIRAFTGDDRARGMLGPAAAALLPDAKNTVQHNEMLAEGSRHLRARSDDNHITDMTWQFLLSRS